MPTHDPELLKWRSEFPILENTVYMNSNSLGAMPKGVYDSMQSFADIWATRGVRAWHEGWIDMVTDVANIYADVMGAPHGSVSLHQNVAIAQWIILSALEFKKPRNKVVYTGMKLPVGNVHLRGAAPSRRRRPRRRERGRHRRRHREAPRRDRRGDAARPGLARALPQCLRPGRQADHREGAFGRRDGPPRRLPELRRPALRREGAEGRLRRRRLGQVDLRRPGRRLSLRASRPRRDPRAHVHRLVRAREALRVRPRQDQVGGTRAQVSRTAHRTSRRSTRRRGGISIIREVGVDRIRQNSLALTDRIIGTRRQARLHPDRAARPRATAAAPSPSTCLTPSRLPPRCSSATT